jgi:hypothetical protein
MLRWNRVVSLLLVIGGLIAHPCSAQILQNPTRLVLPITPDLLLHGDVNGDGIDDLVYSDITGPDTIHTLLGTATGAYQAGPVLTLPSLVYDSCVLGDYNGDHQLDLACNYETTTNASVAFFFGNGDGSFAAAKYVPLPPSPYDYFYLSLVSPGDLNGDGVADLLAVDGLNGWSWPVLSNGSGGFTIGPKQVVLSATFLDVNGDGKIDAISQTGSVAFGRGDGTFNGYFATSIPNYNVCAYGDLDGDGHPDAACVYTENVMGDIVGAWDLQVFHGNPDGTFNATPEYKKVYGDKSNEWEHDGTLGTPILVADVNNDGYPDIVTSALDGTTVIYGGPGLTFATPLHFVTDQFYGSKGFVADVNHDGLLDFVAVGDNGIDFSYGQKSGNLKTAQAFEVTGVIGYAGVADFNGDGIPDVVTSGDNSLTIALGKGDGTFLPYVDIQPGAAYFSGLYEERVAAQLLHGDFNGDGKEDIIAYGSSDVNGFYSTYYYLAGNGDGTFQPMKPVVSKYPYGGSSDVTYVRDLNGDGRADILHAPDTIAALLHVQLSNGDGSFRTSEVPVPVEGGSNGFAIAETVPAAADFNGDGKLDLVFAAQAYAYVMLGAGDGTFSLSTKLTLPPLPGSSNTGSGIAVTTGDFDGDGNQDIAVLFGQFLYGVYGFATTETIVFYGDGHGGFSAPVIANSGANGYAALKAQDINQDGRAEIILHGEGSLNGGTNIGVLHGLANRTFLPETNYSAGIGLSSMEIADLNRDGLPDLVFANGDFNGPANSVTVLLNQGNVPAVTGTIFATPEPSYVGSPFSLVAGLVTPDGSTLTGNVDFLLDGAAIGSAALTQNTATFPVANLPAVGRHSMQANWQGNATFAPVMLTGTHLVLGLPTALSLSCSPSSIPVFSTALLSATVSSTYGTATGSIAWTDNGAALSTQTLAGGTTTLTYIGQTTGAHTLTATYLPTGGFAASSASCSEVVTALPTTSVLTVSPTNTALGSPVTLTATVAPATPPGPGTPSGSVTFSNGGTLLGTSPLANGVASLTLGTLPIGIDDLTCTYNGSAIYATSNCNTIPTTITAAATSLTLTSNLNPAPTGTAVLFAAHLSTNGQPAAAGNLIVLSLNGQTIHLTTDATGSATYSINTLAPGSYPVAVNFAATAILQTSSASLTEVITAIATTTSLSVTPNPAYVNQPVTMTAIVSDLNALTPAGTVTFFDGATPLTTQSTTAGTATYITSALAVGTHPITATYNASSSFLTSSSHNVNEVILPSSFTIALSPTTLTLASGTTGTDAILLSSVGNFAGPLTLTYGTLPKYATALIAPATVTLPAGGTGTSTLTLKTLLQANNSIPRRPGSQEVPMVLSALLLALVPLRSSRRRGFARLLPITLLLVSLQAFTGCTTAWYAGEVVSAGTYQLPITATDLNGNTQTASLTVIVTP